VPPAQRVAILQSNYLPWKGYFDLIHDVDLFVFYDDVQYTKNDWRNRNKIKTPNGPMWLTVPTGTALDRLVCDVRLNDAHWAQKHWKSLQQFYSAAPHFKRYQAFFEQVYLGTRWESLSELNQYLIKAISRDHLGIQTRFADSRAYPTPGRKLDRLMELLAQLDAKTYVSGPAAKSYIDAVRFEQAGIELVYKSYEGYPQYEQRYPPFEHSVSIVDLLFNTGPEASSYVWGWRQASAGER
jgi:WbqC-like protein family